MMCEKVLTMKKMWEIIKKHYELITYTVLSVLLFCACFYPAFAWVVAIFVVVFAGLLHDETKLIGLMLFLNCFYTLFNYQKICGITLDIVIAGYLMVMIFVLYLYRVFKREQRLNYKTLITIGLFLIYVVLPFHECYWQDFFATLFFFVFVYIVFAERRQINFVYVVRMFVAGIIISCLFALLREVSSLLKEKIHLWNYSGLLRFQGLVFHPNTLYGLIVIAICAMALLKYKNKISLTEFLLTFIPMFIFGYLTLSRAFIVSIAVGLIIFIVFYFFKDNVKSLALFGVFIVVICIVGGIFFGATKVYFERISNDMDVLSSTQETRALAIENLDEIFESHSAEWQQAVWKGEIHFDPGRQMLRELYLRDWSSSPKTIWLGRGISRPLIGQMSAHNLYIQELWKHGIIGCFFYAAMILCSINWKNIKQKIKIYLPVLLVLAPYILITTVEQCMLDYVRIMLILLSAGFLEQLSTPEIDKIQSNVEKPMDK